MTPGAPPPLKHELLGDIRAMIETVNVRADEINRRWGMNRLPHLVPLDWLDRFRAQKRKWETACFECAGSPKPEDRDTVRKHGEAMLRAFDKLEALAIEDGYLPEPAQHWEFLLNDETVVMLVRNRTEMSQLDPKGRTVQIWSLEEIVDIIEKFPALIKTKECFPGAEMLSLRTSRVVTDALNDSLEDLPF